MLLRINGDDAGAWLGTAPREVGFLLGVHEVSGGHVQKVFDQPARAPDLTGLRQSRRSSEAASLSRRVSPSYGTAATALGTALPAGVSDFETVTPTWP